jgi:uncharacterized protein
VEIAIISDTHMQRGGRRLPDRCVARLQSAELILLRCRRRPGRAQRLRASFPEADAVLFGHSLLPLHERIAGGFQLFNPGSPTERRRAPQHTMGIARADMGQLTFERVSLG